MIEALLKKIKSRDRSVDVTGTQGSEKAYVTARIFSQFDQPVAVVLPSQKAALAFIEDLAFFLPDCESGIVYFPGYNILPFRSLAYHSVTATSRISGLYRMMSDPKPFILVTYVDTLLQQLIPKIKLSGCAELIINGEEIDRDLLIAKLNAGGYVRTSLVEEPGDFAVRGGILDIFSPGSPNPVRVELFGDYVESLRYFSPLTQRGISEIEEIEIIPASEVVVEKAQVPHILARLRRAGLDGDTDPLKIRSCVDGIREQGRFPGLESMLSIVYPKLDSLLSYLPDTALVLLDQSEEIEASAIDFQSKALENFNRARSEKRLCVAPDSLYLDWKTVKAAIEKRNPVKFKQFHLRGSADENQGNCPRLRVEDNGTLSEALKRIEGREHLLQPLADWFFEKRDSGMAAVAVCSSDAQKHRLVSLLSPYGIEPTSLESFKSVIPGLSGIFVTKGTLSSGFVFAEESLALVTDQEIFGAKKQRRIKGARRAKSEFITPEELKAGDIVVHLEHGLGRYEGLVTIKVEGLAGDFILISYRDDDKLYLPVDRMEMIEKYVGVEGYSPLLDKIGGKTWLKSKAKAKKEVEKMAGELLKLYAERRVSKGFAFSPPDRFFTDFEASFPYEETPDQLKAIDDVLADMEDPTPMDRLVCGDVGYGKTEVALRAAFKAVKDNKQAAIVVPTTLLAEQHLKTFRQRFDALPVTIEALSRFRSKKEQTTIVNGLSSGKIDIVIGTHRLLQKDVSFKSLGLLVIDEEQRFGVKHKETLKKRRSTVDVLALTATPIPRTLHMSLTGMRDISVISTPPEDRRAIVSYISEYDDTIAAEAIRKELARQGQIFFIHNNIKSIFKTAENLQKLVPEVRLGVAHGRLTESSLEKVMFQFVNREIDMLVCTTIVESGLDIPSANTMIINKADQFGLSQIYQLRGRIGRGEEQAYAYLFIPEENRLSRDARKRLAALMEHRDLGSGFQIAMKDLQIRGSGAALGASQSGHIAAVGYDMFLKLLDEAVSDLKGNPVVERLEPEISITVSAYISDDYVQSIEQRLTLYRRLSQITELPDISAIQQELIDRFGPLPEAAKNMLIKIMFRVLCVKAGIRRLDLSNNSLALIFSEIHQKRPAALALKLPDITGNFKFSAENAVRIILGPKGITPSQAFGKTKRILDQIAVHVNP